MKTYFLDTETTGLHSAKICEIALIDGHGNIVLDELINPGIPIPPGASAIHGITDDMVANAKPIEAYEQMLFEKLSSSRLIIYNASYDLPLLPPKIQKAPAEIECCMLRSTRYMAYRKDCDKVRWPKLTVMADLCGHVWQGQAHRALADTIATRAVWLWLDQERENEIIKIKEKQNVE